MPRLSGSTNTSEYKYKVEELNTDTNEWVCSKYFRTQKEIQAKYNLKRSAVYFHLHNKEMRKTKDNINIIKLTEPKPVYEVQTIYNRIVY